MNEDEKEKPKKTLRAPKRFIENQTTKMLESQGCVRMEKQPFKRQDGFWYWPTYKDYKVKTKDEVCEKLGKCNGYKCAIYDSVGCWWLMPPKTKKRKRKAKKSGK
jgi:hypothetical protein